MNRLQYHGADRGAHLWNAHRGNNRNVDRIRYRVPYLCCCLCRCSQAKIAFRFMDPHTDKPMFITLAIQTCMVMLMVPIMTLIVNFIHNGFTADWLPRWLTQWALCLPMAFFWQILYAGPVVRLIFRTIFRKQLQTASAEH